MLRKFDDIFNRIKNTINNGGDQEGIRTEIVDINDIDEVIDDIDKVMNIIDYEISIINCTHDWIDYDDIKINNAAKENDERIKYQSLRILTKKLDGPLEELDAKMLELLVTWSPPRQKVMGKCMMCDKNVIVMYIRDNNHGVMY